MSEKNIAKLLNSVSKEYVCDICGTPHKTHREAVQCADNCLQENQDVEKVEA